MRETIRALLANDTELAALLTGGVYAGEEISRQGTPDAFDAGGEILPCALVSLETESGWGPYPTSARLYVRVTFYEHSGYDTIDAAIERTYALLHRTKAGVGSGVWEVAHAGDVRDQEDQALECSLSIGRYVATRKR